MFTGLIQATGAVAETYTQGGTLRLVIDPQGYAPASGRPVQTGDSIAIDGTCLTVVSLDQGRWAFDAVPETLDRTTLGHLAPGDPVHLEPALAAGEPLGGHLVQGHVDGVGHVAQPATEANHWRLGIEAPPPQGANHLADYLLPKGSVTVAGVSLTIASKDPDNPARFDIALIPETLTRTKLGGLQPGDPVNLEVDLFAKAVVDTTQRYLEAQSHGSAKPEVTAQTLRDAGFLS
ncbi:MAG: riboflavin synthase [Planctomycetota bacterium]